MFTTIVMAKKKPTRQNTLRCSIASAYLLTNHSAQAGLLFIQSSAGVEKERLKSPHFNKAILHCSGGIAIRYSVEFQNRHLGHQVAWGRAPFIRAHAFHVVDSTELI